MIDAPPHGITAVSSKLSHWTEVESCRAGSHDSDIDEWRHDPGRRTVFMGFTLFAYSYSCTGEEEQVGSLVLREHRLDGSCCVGAGWSACGLAAQTSFSPATLPWTVVGSPTCQNLKAHLHQDFASMWSLPRSPDAVDQRKNTTLNHPSLHVMYSFSIILRRNTIRLSISEH